MFFCNLKNCLAIEKYNYINNGQKNVILKIPEYYFIFSEEDKNMDKDFFIMNFQSTVKYWNSLHIPTLFYALRKIILLILLLILICTYIFFKYIQRHYMYNIY